MQTSESLAKLAPALVAASAEIEGAAKSAVNSHFKNKYATLESVIEATRGPLANNDLCIVQAPGVMTGNLLTVTTRLVHASGEWMQVEYQIPLKANDPQASGSSITYARRYALQALLNVPALDDDAERGHGRGGDLITAEQLAEIEKLLKDSGVKVEVVLAAAGVKALAEMPAAEFGGIRSKLQATIRNAQPRKAA